MKKLFKQTIFLIVLAALLINNVQGGLSDYLTITIPSSAKSYIGIAASVGAIALIYGIAIKSYNNSIQELIRKKDHIFNNVNSTYESRRRRIKELSKLIESFEAKRIPFFYPKEHIDECVALFKKYAELQVSYIEKEMMSQEQESAQKIREQIMSEQNSWSHVRVNNVLYYRIRAMVKHKKTLQLIKSHAIHYHFDNLPELIQRLVSLEDKIDHKLIEYRAEKTKIMQMPEYEEEKKEMDARSGFWLEFHMIERAKE